MVQLDQSDLAAQALPVYFLALIVAVVVGGVVFAVVGGPWSSWAGHVSLLFCLFGFDYIGGQEERESERIRERERGGRKHGTRRGRRDKSVTIPAGWSDLKFRRMNRLSVVHGHSPLLLLLLLHPCWANLSGSIFISNCSYSVTTSLEVALAG